jgi:hypothetical protein
VDPTTFDALLRRVARQTTRRAALVTLLTGALLLNDLEASEATKKAQRRKDRRRKQRRKQARSPFKLRPISVWVHNRGGKMVTVQYGWWNLLIPDYMDCVNNTKVQIRSGEKPPLRSIRHTEYLWINNKYWIDFQNPITRPGIRAAVNGRPPYPRHPSASCPPRGTEALDYTTLKEGQTVNFTINGLPFRVTRNRDTNYKEFTLELPTL